jgi:hypothetical protein
VEGSRFCAPHEIPDRHTFCFEAVEDKPRELVITEGARIVAGSSQAACSDQSRARKTAGMPFTATDGRFRVGPGKLVEEEQVIYGDRAESENVKGRIHLL